MRFIQTDLPGVVLIEPQVFGDNRGFFMETYHRTKFRSGGIAKTFLQDNHSWSRKGALRGLHYQIEHPQGRLVRVVQGSVFDVSVDLRRSSPTFGQWMGEILSAENRHQLWVPPGFAHGFYVTSESADLLYKCTDLYAPDDDHILSWNDSEIGIEWPLVGGEPPVLSDKDAGGKRLQDAVIFP